MPSGYSGSAWSIRPALLFLTKFLAFSLALFAVWKPVANAYLTLTLPAVNAVCRTAGRPVRVQASGREMVTIYTLDRGEFTLWAGNPDVVFLNLIVLVGLFGAFGPLALRRRIGRLGLALAVLWITHVAHFCLLSYTAIWEYLRGMLRAQGALSAGQQALAEWAARAFPHGQSMPLNLALDFWRNWGMLAFAFLLWLALNGRDLRTLGMGGRPAGHLK